MWWSNGTSRRARWCALWFGFRLSLAAAGFCQAAFAEQPQPQPQPPPESGAAGLLLDVRRAVDAYQQDGWFADEEALSELARLLLPSVCRTLPTQRAAALGYFRGQLPPTPAAELFGRAGRRTAAVDAALTAERHYQALERGLRRADECPFWVVPEKGFSGRQTVRDQWVWHAEGGGRVDVTRRGGRLFLGAGGAGRLLFGRGFGNHFSLLGGLEAGGGADLRRSDTDQFTINYIFGAPLVLRRRELNWLYDLELAPMAQFEPDDLRVSWGARLGAGAGVAVLRTRDFLPWAGFALALEHYFEGAGRPARQALRGGIRVGIRWLPGSP